MSKTKSEESVNKSNVEEFMLVTGASHDKAVEYLKINNLNLEVAVNMYLEASCQPFNEYASTSKQSSHTQEESILSAFSENEETEVRAPIPQKRAVLVEDQYHALPYTLKRRTATNSVFDNCRDFQKETEEKEKSLNSKSTAKKTHLKRLHELFRPPVDILHHGDFQSARNASNSSKRWLLVNIQNTIEFACQVLNRDVWSDKLVREIIVSNFILWQVYHDCDDGLHYQTFYAVGNFPHLAVIDPRTGERMAVWENFGIKPTPEKFIELATIFLSDHSLNSSTETDGLKQSQNNSSIIEQSEEAQLEAALKASLSNHNTVDNQSFTYADLDSSDNESDVDNSFKRTNHSPKSKKQKLESSLEKLNEHGGLKAEELSNTNTLQPSADRKLSTANILQPSTDERLEEVTLLLRLPNNSRKQISFGSDRTIEELKNEICFLGFPSSKYELIKPFPRTNISTLDSAKTLRSAGFHKQETIFIQER